MRRNKVVITLTAKTEIDEELLSKISEERGVDADEYSIAMQKKAIEAMLEEYSAYDDFEVELDITMDLDETEGGIIQ